MSRVFAGLGLLGAALLSRKKSGSYQEVMLRQYLETALWSSTGDDEEPLDRDYGIEDIAEEAKEKARKDVQSFIEKAGELLDDVKASSAGHDFWLTRNHHGAGFWDGDYPERIGDALTKLSHEYGEETLYEGDDGLIHLL